jgi:ribosome-binding factor A
MTQRTDRIDALLREEIGTILSRDLSDPAIGFTTITDVETAPDLSHAQVWVSQIGQAPEREASLAALRRALPYVRRLLGQRVRLRRIPELHLRVDDTAERGTRVLKLLAELDAGAAPEEAVVAADPLPTPVARLPREGEPDVAPLAAAATPPSRHPKRRDPRSDRASDPRSDRPRDRTADRHPHRRDESARRGGRR